MCIATFYRKKEQSFVIDRSVNWNYPGTIGTKCRNHWNQTPDRRGNHARNIHIWEDYKEWQRLYTLSDSGKEIYKQRKERIERSFADSKELHGLRYC